MSSPHHMRSIIFQIKLIIPIPYKLSRRTIIPYTIEFFVGNLIFINSQENWKYRSLVSSKPFVFIIIILLFRCYLSPREIITLTNRIGSVAPRLRSDHFRPLGNPRSTAYSKYGSSGSSCSQDKNIRQIAKKGTNNLFIIGLLR